MALNQHRGPRKAPINTFRILKIMIKRGVNFSSKIKDVPSVCVEVNVSTTLVEVYW